MFRKLLIPIVRMLARATVRKFKPEVVAVTGSAGKTSTKEAIYTVLKCRYHVRKNHANFNNEIGVPLTILGDYKKSGGLFFWIPVLIKSSLRILTPKFFQGSSYPEILILEYGADRPGDIEYLTNVARPSIAVETLVGETPVHVEFYPNAEAVAKEKEKLVAALSTTSYAVLNKDDLRVFGMKDATRGKVLTYGKDDDADVKITEVEVEKGVDGSMVPSGIRFVLSYNNESIPVRIPGVIGTAQAYATAAATAVGISKGMKLVEVAKALSYYRAPQHRLTFLRGKEQSLIIDDSYNSSPAAAKHALESLKDLGATRTVCVLGDMRELGSYTEAAHKKIGTIAAKACTVLVTIGPSAAIIADEAERGGLPKERIHRFQTTDEAVPEVVDLVQKGDAVLVKASLSIGAKKVVEALRV